MTDKKNKVLVIVGPSGVGKDTLMNKVKEKFSPKIKKGVTHTTRKMREGEKEGVNYYYVSEQEFLQLDKENKMIEHNFYNGNYYGLSKMELEKYLTGDIVCYVVIDINGAQSVNKAKIPANFIGILPPKEEALLERLKGRGSEKEEAIKGRLEIAKKEMNFIKESNLFDHKIINGDFDKALEELENLIVKLYPNLK